MLPCIPFLQRKSQRVAASKRRSYADMEMAALEEDEVWDEDPAARHAGRSKRRRVQAPTGSEDRRFGAWEIRDLGRAHCIGGEGRLWRPRL